MSRDNKGLDINILGREFRVACAEAEQDGLILAAQYLDQKMREIREQGKVIGIERIAVMAALNIAFELQNKPLNGAGTNAVDISTAQRRIEAMEAMIDEVMRPQETLFGLPLR